MYYIRVLIYSCDSGEDVRKVNVNREEGIHRQREEVWLIRVGCCIEVRHSTMSKGRSSDLLFNPAHHF